MSFSASPGVATRPRTPHLLVSRSMLRHSASRVHRCRRHSSSASSESLARYLLLPTASAPAKRLSAAQFLSPPSLLYVPLMPLFTFCFTSHIQLPFPVAAQSGPVCHRDYGPRRAALRVVTPHSVRLSCMPVSSYGCLHPYPLIISRDRSRAEDAMRKGISPWT